MVTLIVFFYVPVLILSEKFLGSLYPGVLIIVLPSFLYLVIKQGIEFLFGLDSMVFGFFGKLIKIVFYLFILCAILAFFAALAWGCWELFFNYISVL